MPVFENVGFYYRRGQEVLRGVSFSIGEGEYVSIVGGNGSGKSTLAKLMNGLLLPKSGTVAVQGRTTSDPRHLRFIRESIGLIFQNPDDQFITTNVTDEIVFGLENVRVPAGEIGKRIRLALAAVGLEAYAESAPHELSGGQKQRAAVAAVLAMRPRILVFDEATSMLDPGARADMKTLMRKLHEGGIGIVQITHHMDEVLDSERVLLLDRGTVAFDGRPEAFFRGVPLERYGLEKPFAVRVHEELGWTGIPGADWKERAAAQWKRS
ncbi:ATP-binding cassette domain-containing protein [Saccharibacillus alkalitolerans]|uniref:ATP-binding cassette domain-containing protein n=1 Tax=Saccharibacillus alkalitolerans TaxID=2705290 RepID=A0ABX0F473_9BACL|nr:ATP-binding cassette domain-containing protein [Saccharibacillus alkalitolerans]NGZ74670.1 ATP-binding cassette domain-containing protein [Saccharibacillus alkalitolerans]